MRSSVTCRLRPCTGCRSSPTPLTRSRSREIDEEVGIRGGTCDSGGSRLPAADVTKRDGIRVTTPARTVVDLACTIPPFRSVPVGDAALHKGTERIAIEAALLERAGRRDGHRQRQAGDRHARSAQSRVSANRPAASSSGTTASRIPSHSSRSSTPMGSWPGSTSRWPEFRHHRRVRRQGQVRRARAGRQDPRGCVVRGEGA